MCSPGIVFIILKIYHVFTRYRRIAGKHIENRPHIVFRGFFCKMCLEDFQDWLYYHLPPPTPTQFIILTCFADLCSSGPVSQTQKGEKERGGLEYDAPPPHLFKIREQCKKKVLRIVLDYRFLQPVLKKNHACVCVFPVSNFWSRLPHDPVSTHD